MKTLYFITFAVIVLIIPTMTHGIAHAQTDLTDKCASDIESKKAASINQSKAVSLAALSQTYAVNSIGYYITFDHVWYDGIGGRCHIDVEFDFYNRGPYAWCIKYMDFQEDLDLNNITKLINYGGNCQQPNPNRNLIHSDSTIYDGIAHVVPSPLKQYESGVLIDSVRCKDDFRLVVSKSGPPACFTPEHATISVQRGWGHWPINGA